VLPTHAGADDSDFHAQLLFSAGSPYPLHGKLELI